MVPVSWFSRVGVIGSRRYKMRGSYRIGGGGVMGGGGRFSDQK